MAKNHHGRIACLQKKMCWLCMLWNFLNIFLEVHVVGRFFVNEQGLSAFN